MPGVVTVKICGITRVEDAHAAAACGAAYLGFVFHPKSPRALSPERFLEIRDALPALPWVYVQVLPERGELVRAREIGFSFFQAHLPHDHSPENVATWSKAVAPENLWLAPKTPPGVPFPDQLLPYADTFLLDTYKCGIYGGTGKTGDWNGFRKTSNAHPEKNWVLAGGLNPENLRTALDASGARTVDVSSGVESEPGVKDADRIRKLFEALG